MIEKIKKSNPPSWMKNFTTFTGIGLFYAILQIILLWALVDMQKFNTLLTTILVAFTVYITKFYTYVYVKLIKNEFMHYNAVNLALLILSILFIWFLVDFLGFWASYSSAIVATLFFVLRFFVLSKTELIKN